MNRYKLNSVITVTHDPFHGREIRCAKSIMEDNPQGEWVRWSDIKKLRDSLEDQIPDKRIARLKKMIGHVAKGECPECGAKTRNYKAPSGYFAPELFATLREEGYDPCTGHKMSCSLRGESD